MGIQPDGVRAKNCAVHTIDIAAPAELVWAIVSDIDGWHAWNPLYTAASGEPQVGAPMTFSVVLEGMKPQKGKATICAVEPCRLLEYRTGGMGGLVKAHRFIEIAQVGTSGCRVANGEIMGGLIGPLIYRLLGEKVRHGLQGMNEQLKRQAERAAVREET
ncbi:MAG: SRPBCC domain-containing protein [Novosphingobium sp.]|nr:SRPBCC domain-containing protein [Novosphingobium sp.]